MAREITPNKFLDILHGGLIVPGANTAVVNFHKAAKPTMTATKTVLITRSKSERINNSGTIKISGLTASEYLALLNALGVWASYSQTAADLYEQVRAEGMRMWPSPTENCIDPKTTNLVVTTTATTTATDSDPAFTPEGPSQPMKQGFSPSAAEFLAENPGPPVDPEAVTRLPRLEDILRNNEEAIARDAARRGEEPKAEDAPATAPTPETQEYMILRRVQASGTSEADGDGEIPSEPCQGRDAAGLSCGDDSCGECYPPGPARESEPGNGPLAPGFYLEFTNKDGEDFSGATAAVAFLEKMGYSVGSTQRAEPRGIKFGDYAIQKWRNLDLRDRAGLDGEVKALNGDGRRCGVAVMMYDAETLAKNRAVLGK